MFPRRMHLSLPPAKALKEVACCDSLAIPSRCGTKNESTGLPSSSGSGPATPVTATARLARAILSAPIAIASATSLHTAPLCFRSFNGTPKTMFFIGFV